MKYSQLFGKTVKDVAKDIKLTSHKLLLQGGFIRESVAGRYFFLPLGMRVQDKIVAIVEEEMNKCGAQKMITPVLHPLELWEETNRTNSVGFELMTIKDQRGASFALGGTAEEMMVDVVRKFNTSYKDLPFNIYQFSAKFRDEKRARGGLLRVREFLMKDAYSFHADEKDFAKEYKAMWEAYTRIFERVGLKTMVIESDNGYIGGDYCHEFVVESEIGESRFLMTEDGKYAAHEEVAVFEHEDKNSSDEMGELHTVKTDRGPKMEDAAKFHGLPLWQQMKNVLYKDNNGRFIMASIRGDYDVNEIKLKHLAGVYSLEVASEEDLKNKIHSVRGFISPYKIREKIEKGVELLLVGDTSVRTIKNTYIGANEDQIEVLNVNVDRDFAFDLEGDIAMAQPGFAHKGGNLIEKRGIEVGNIFQLGTHYSDKMAGAVFTDNDGKSKPFYMGCYGIGIGRTMGTIVEMCNDEKGMMWPKSVAPYLVQLVSLGTDEVVMKAAEKLYKDLQKAGIEVLFDDRDAGAGQKLNDADLIGNPLRLVISKRTLEGESVEWKERAASEASSVALKDVVKKVQAFAKA